MRTFILSIIALSVLGYVAMPSETSIAEAPLQEPARPSSSLAAIEAPESKKEKAAAPSNIAATPVAQKTVETAKAPSPLPIPGIPARLVIPSIAFNNPIVTVGVNSKGDMDVPDGKTANVGWYSGGTLPGNTGSAVIGAHVYAAFKNLHKVQVGDIIEVVTQAGDTLRFKVETMKTRALSDMSPEELFNRADAKRLNLITCAGTRTPDGSTYTHRLVVYATLIE